MRHQGAVARYAAAKTWDEGELAGLIEAAEGKAILLEVVSMTAGLIARFSHALQEDAAPYGENTEIEEKEKE